MTKRENVRFWLAVAISPAFPLTIMSINEGKGAWPLIFFFGYLYALLIAMPMMSVLRVSGRLISCLVVGGIATVLPLLLLSALSLLTGDGLTWEQLRYLGIFFEAGAGAGVLFWAIAFWGETPAEAKRWN